VPIASLPADPAFAVVLPPPATLEVPAVDEAPATSEARPPVASELDPAAPPTSVVTCPPDPPSSLDRLPPLEASALSLDLMVQAGTEISASSVAPSTGRIVLETKVNRLSFVMVRKHTHATALAFPISVSN
jgi:hypothetical protein